MKLRLNIFAVLMCVAVSPAARADDARELFVESNILAVFYHELGHAVIDLMNVPIFGQEEDAADVMAVLLIDWLFEEQTAQEIAYDSAIGYLSDPEQLEDVAWWDLHGPDEQRFYNHVCIFYGGNPSERDDLAADLGLPDARAETCPEEYDLAADSWGAVFDEMDSVDQGNPMQFVPGGGPDSEIVNRVLSEEVQRMSSDLTLPEPVEVRVEACGEANAFYDPGDISITFCIEFVDHLRELFDSTFE